MMIDDDVYGSIHFFEIIEKSFLSFRFIVTLTLIIAILLYIHWDLAISRVFKGGYRQLSYSYLLRLAPDSGSWCFIIFIIKVVLVDLRDITQKAWIPIPLGTTEPSFLIRVKLAETKRAGSRRLIRITYFLRWSLWWLEIIAQELHLTRW